MGDFQPGSRPFPARRRTTSRYVRFRRPRPGAGRPRSPHVPRRGRARVVRGLPARHSGCGAAGSTTSSRASAPVQGLAVRRVAEDAAHVGLHCERKGERLRLAKALGGSDAGFGLLQGACPVDERRRESHRSPYVHDQREVIRAERFLPLRDAWDRSLRLVEDPGESPHGLWPRRTWSPAARSRSARARGASPDSK